MRKNFLILFVCCSSFLAPSTSSGQAAQDDSSKVKVNKDAVYDRPFITIAKTRTAVGGYVEGNTNYFATDGISEGFSMELRRFNMFLYSSIGSRIKFLSEVEFEHGVEEINLETAQLDFEINEALNFRTGIILVPIGGFNQNHDGPKWEFIERPLVCTQIIPSTLSEVGFGFHGKVYESDLVLSYEAYVVNGLRDGILFNAEGRTFLPAGKDPEMFGEDNNGVPMLTGRVGIKHSKIAELGLSYYGGTYNTFRIEGAEVEKKRNLSLFAADISSSFWRMKINAEFAYAAIDVPEAAGSFFGSKQWGGYAEVVFKLLERNILGFENTSLNASLRAESIDYNIGTFPESGTKIYDEVKAIVPGISIRPSPETVIRFNYRYHWERDLLGNPTIHTAGFQVGVASYF